MLTSGLGTRVILMSGLGTRVILMSGLGTRVMLTSGLGTRVMLTSGLGTRVMLTSGLGTRVMLTSGLASLQLSGPQPSCNCSILEPDQCRGVRHIVFQGRLKRRRGIPPRLGVWKAQNPWRRKRSESGKSASLSDLVPLQTSSVGAINQHFSTEGYFGRGDFKLTAGQKVKLLAGQMFGKGCAMDVHRSPEVFLFNQRLDFSCKMCAEQRGPKPKSSTQWARGRRGTLSHDWPMIQSGSLMQDLISKDSHRDKEGTNTPPPPPPPHRKPPAGREGYSAKPCKPPLTEH